MLKIKKQIIQPLSWPLSILAQFQANQLYKLTLGKIILCSE
jgi:hypothetical protein